MKFRFEVRTGWKGSVGWFDHGLPKLPEYTWYEVVESDDSFGILGYIRRCILGEWKE